MKIYLFILIFLFIQVAAQDEFFGVKKAEVTTIMSDSIFFDYVTLFVDAPRYEVIDDSISDCERNWFMKINTFNEKDERIRTKFINGEWLQFKYNELILLVDKVEIDSVVVWKRERFQMKNDFLLIFDNKRIKLFINSEGIYFLIYRFIPIKFEDYFW